jgi:hypothetical protein
MPGLDPGIHRRAAARWKSPCEEMDCLGKPGNDQRLLLMN